MNIIFDMIGYWSSVTVVTVVLLYGVFILGTLSLDKWFESISEGKSTKVVKSNLPMVLQYGEGILVFIGCMVSSTCVVIFLISSMTDPRLVDITYIQRVNNLALLLTPFFSWVTSTLMGLYIIHVVTKKGYKLTQAVKELERKSKQ